jgi:glycosyltransferase involved in cell wall biosynthesis
MRVLLVNDGHQGGSIVAMNRLHGGLKEAGINSKILNRVNLFKSADVIDIPQPRGLWRAESLLRKLTWRLGLNDIHCLNTFWINKMNVYLDADILNLHTIHGGFFNYLALPRLTANKPAIFSLHDMWSFTGHCSFSFDCDRWKTGCGKCPYLNIVPPVQRDNTRLEWKLKNWAYSHSNLAVVTPSKWLTERAKESMLKELPIHYIPHGVDIEVYRPLDREQCRSMLGIPPKKKVLMFSAMNMNRSHSHSFRKGCDLLLEALGGLPESLKAECKLLLIGEGGTPLAQSVGINAIDLGYLSNDHLQAIAYSASDLFLCPTRAETFGLVLLESLACGTPVVSFAVGPIPELVRPGITGYLAEPENAKSFRDGIVAALEDDRLRNEMRQNCRDIAVSEYPLQLQVQRYVKLYHEVLRN